MKKGRFKSFDEFLDKQLKNPEFKMLFERGRFYLDVARLVSKLRMKKGISQEELARIAGVSQPLIARLEKGDPQRTPTFETINKILNALGYTVEFNLKPISKKAA